MNLQNAAQAVLPPIQNENVLCGASSLKKILQDAISNGTIVASEAIDKERIDNLGCPSTNDYIRATASPYLKGNRCCKCKLGSNLICSGCKNQETCKSNAGSTKKVEIPSRGNCCNKHCIKDDDNFKCFHSFSVKYPGKKDTIDLRIRYRVSEKYVNKNDKRDSKGNIINANEGFIDINDGDFIRLLKVEGNINGFIDPNDLATIPKN